MDTPERLSVNGAEYAILRLLGKGKGGYSYLAQREGTQCVLKQIHHEPCEYYQFGDKLAAELRDYETLKGLDIPLPALLGADRAAERLLKEYISGPTIYRLVLEGAVEPWHWEQVRAMSQRLRGAGLNIDWFHTNFIPHEGVLYYVDYECNEFMEQWSFEAWGAGYWARTEQFDAYARGHGDI